MDPAGVGVTAARVLEVARSQLGTVESPPNSNHTPYGVAYGMDRVAWCAIFCWWTFQQAGVGNLIPKSAYTPAIADWFRARRQWGTVPAVGALALFDFPGDQVNRISHIGIVEAVNRDGSVICIEGNTAPGTAGSQRDGGGVYRRTRKVGIVGYGYPAYAAPASTAPAAVKAAAKVGLQRTEEDDMFTDQDRALLAQLARRADVGHARDQVLTALGEAEPEMAPVKRTPEQAAAIAPARRVDVGFALDQLTGKLGGLDAKLSALIEVLTKALPAAEAQEKEPSS